MADRPIIFSAPMIRALLAGRKTQTRRPLSPHNLRIWTGGLDYSGHYVKPERVLFSAAMNNARDFRSIEGRLAWITDPAVHQSGAIMAQWLGRLTYAPGDRLWVKERWALVGGADYADLRGIKDPAWCYPERDRRYFADGDAYDGAAEHWLTSLYMPRWASRITLTITDVRVQKLHEISEGDARREGCPRLVVDDDGHFYESERGTHRSGFAGGWDHLHGAGAWYANPEVVAITFTVERRNIDA
jgi:hypothetical protein